MSEYLKSDDAALVERLKNGDSQAYDELVRQYDKQLFAFIIRFVNDYDLAEDIFQETWIKVIRAIKGFRGDSKLSSWLFQIALNQSRDSLRKKGRHTHVSLDGNEALEVPSPPNVSAEKIHTKEEVKRIVASLPDKMREVIVLKYYHDLNDAEISEIAGCPEGTVKSRLHRAAKIIRSKWTRTEQSILNNS